MHPLNDNNYNEDRYRLSVLYVLESKGMSESALADAAGMDVCNLNSFLSAKRGVRLPVGRHDAVMHALGAETYADLYAMGEEAAQETVGSEHFTRTIHSVLTKQNVSLAELEKRTGLNSSYLSKIFSNNAAIPIYNRIKICAALGIATLADLRDIGDTLAQENPFDVDRFRTALSRILDDKGIRPARLSEMTGIARSQISAFQNGSRVLSIHNCHLICEALGAKNFREFYKMGGVPLDNGITAFVDRLVTEVNAKPAQGTIGEMLNTPIKNILANPEYQGQIIATDKKAAAR